MKKENNLISTKDKLIENFTAEQLEIFEFYKSQFSYNDKLLPVEKEDKELVFMEKTYNILQNIFKVEVILTLLVVTFAVIFYIIPENKEAQVKYGTLLTVYEEDSYNIEN